MYKTKYKVTKETYKEIMNAFNLLKISSYFILLAIIVLMYFSYKTNSPLVLFGSYFVYIIYNLMNGFVIISNYDYYKEISLNNGVQPINELEFKEKKIEAVEKNSNVYNEFKYDMIVKIIELKNYFILKLVDNFSLVVVKKDIKDKDTFMTFIKTKTDAKYINVNVIKIFRIISLFLPIIIFIFYFCK